MNRIPKFASVMAMIALVAPAFAADPDAAALEKEAVGHWGPDGEAMVKLYTEEKGMEKKDAEAVVGESAHLAVHVEKGVVHLYTKQGILSTPYKIEGVDEDKKTLTLRADGGPDARAAQTVKVRIEKDQIFFEGGQVPFILKKIEEAEFDKRRKDLPARRVGP